MSLTAELVSRCDRPVIDQGHDGSYEEFRSEDFPIVARSLLASKPPGPLWIFAYGSLIWRPEFDFIEKRRAHVHGWHRAFSIVIDRWRGTREQPGLMMGLARGGACVGAACRIAEAEEYDIVERFVRREIDGPDQISGMRWLSLRTPDGPITALTSWAGPTGLDYIVKLPPSRVAAILARACGHWGSGAVYLHNTIVHRAEMGIHDSGLWDLQKRVADEIIQMTGPPSGG
jgi:cation transport protein ChaC